MSWQKLPLRVVAPPEASQQRFAPEQTVWNLTLDQIESHTDRIINKQLTPASKAGSSTYVFDSGNVLYSKLRPYLNKVIYPAEAGIATTELVPLRPQKSVVDAEYLTYYLRSNYFLKFAEQSVSGARMPRIMMTEFWEHLVPLPPLSEQHRIVEILDLADALRKKRAEADAKAERILPALFTKMFGDPAENTMGWEEKTLAEIETDFRYGTSVKCDSEPNGLPVLRIPNILHGEIDIGNIKYAKLLSQEVNRLLLQEGDLLFVRTNGNPDYVGRCAVFDLGEPYLYASYLIRARLNPDQANSWFVAACLRTTSGRKVMSPFIRTTAGQSNISVEGLKQICIPLPPIEKQRQFQTQLEKFYKLRRAREKARDLIETTFQFLLQRAFSGNLTAKWREVHMSELLAEMEQQAKIIGTTADSDYEQLNLIETQ